MRGKKFDRPVVVPDPMDTLDLTTLTEAKELFDALQQPQAHLLALLE